MAAEVDAPATMAQSNLLMTEVLRDMGMLGVCVLEDITPAHLVRVTA